MAGPGSGPALADPGGRVAGRRGQAGALVLGGLPAGGHRPHAGGLPGERPDVLLQLPVSVPGRVSALPTCPGRGPAAPHPPAAAAGVLLVAVYACNAAVWVHRLDTARAQADGGASQITLPLVPFPQFTANEMAGKGDIVYLVYHQQPWDISFTFVPYEDWAEG